MTTIELRERELLDLLRSAIESGRDIAKAQEALRNFYRKIGMHP